MKSTFLASILLSLFIGGTASSCATIVGTAVSPVTGGVDLVRLETHHWYYMPFVFIGGMLTGPLVAFYNGLAYDTTYRGEESEAYGKRFNQIFRPFLMIRTENVRRSKSDEA